MSIKTILTLSFFFILQCIYSQVSTEELNKAQENLAEIQKLYSKEHIEYAKAAIDLAVLYYQNKEDINSVGEGYDLAYKALVIARREEGATGSLYLNFLSKLPDIQALLIDANIDLEATAISNGDTSVLYAKKLIKLSGASVKDDYEYQYAYEYTLEAYQILVNFPKNITLPVYDYARQVLPSPITEVVEQEVRLEQAQKGKDEIELADALVSFASLGLLYQESDWVYVYLETCYKHLKKALQIYEEKLGKSHPKYQKAYSTLSKEMRDFYPMEKDILTRLNTHKTANDSFIVDFRKFLEKVDEVTILDYDVEKAFSWVLKDLKKHHGGVNSKYYVILNDIKDLWDLDEDEQNFEQQKKLTERTLVEFGISEKYVAELIKEINFSIPFYQTEEEIIQRYNYAFEILEDLEFERSLFAEPVNFFQKYTQEVVQPYRMYLITEHNLTVKKSTFGSKSDSYLSAALEASWNYLKDDAFIEQGEELLLGSLKSLEENQFYLAERWLDSLFLDDPDYNAFILQPVLPRLFPVFYVKRILKAPLELIEKEKGVNSIEYSHLFELIADAYFFSENNPEHPKEALIRYKRLLFAYNNQEGKSMDYEKLLLKVIENLKIRNPWSVDEATFFFNELIRVGKQYTINKNVYPYYAKFYADWHYYNERIISAESYYKEFIKLYPKDTKKEQHLDYLEASYNLARTYRKTGRSNKAFALYSTTLKKSQEEYEFIYSAKCLDGLGLIAHAKGDSEYALKLFNDALNALTEAEEWSFFYDRYNDFEMALLYIKIKRHIARVHLDNRYIAVAERMYNEIKRFEQDEKTPVSFRKDFSLQYDLANLAELRGDSLKAVRYYQAVIRQMKDKDELAKVNIALAQFHEKQNQDSLAAIYLSNALDIDLEQIQKNYTNLAEKERLLFLAPISERLNVFFNFALPKKDSTLTMKAFNAHLTVKGLALETSTNLQSICNQTENTILKNKCFEMQALRKTLAESTTLPLDEQEKINTQIIDLEKDIGVFSKDLRAYFGKNNKKLDFYQLKQILQAVETKDSAAVAIDFLVVDQLVNGFETSIYYAAVIGSDYATPIFVPLATQEDFQDVLGPDIAPNTINYITDEFESRYLYELVWEPLLPYIIDAKQLYICPTGILSKIAFGTLRTGDYDQRRIMDDWSIHYYSSLRDLLNPQVGTLDEEIPNIGLVGGVKFTFSKEEIQSLAQRNGVPKRDFEKALTSQVSQRNDLAFSRGTRGEDFNYLPGTLEEVNAISHIFPKGWIINLLTDTLATEENIEIMADNSPTILHIATHGYFFPTPQKEDEDGWLIAKQTTTLEDKIANLSNPLLRSGLALAGINRVWKGGSEIEGLDDGILTALEVANMDLFNTNLVVLSACETGRGDIDNNEGIMGLRRAFKTAGAKQLLISLWKVPDEQTSELMQLFYKEYINGASAHQAFEIAQHTMRKRYKNPYYWAAFLLIE